MNLGKKIYVATLMTTVVTLASLGAAQAGDYSPVWRTMRPIYAINFDIGRKHVLSYFLSKNGLCDLTVMVSERPSEPAAGKEITPLQTERFKAAIDGGRSAQFDTAEGKAVEYACATGAQSMSIREVNQVAVTSPAAK